MRILYNFKNLN